MSTEEESELIFSFEDVVKFSARAHAPWAADGLRAIGEENSEIARLGCWLSVTHRCISWQEEPVTRIPFNR